MTCTTNGRVCLRYRVCVYVCSKHFRKLVRTTRTRRTGRIKNRVYVSFNSFIFRKTRGQSACAKCKLFPGQIKGCSTTDTHTNTHTTPGHRGLYGFKTERLSLNIERVANVAEFTGKVHTEECGPVCSIRPYKFQLFWNEVTCLLCVVTMWIISHSIYYLYMYIDVKAAVTRPLNFTNRCGL